MHAFLVTGCGQPNQGSVYVNGVSLYPAEVTLLSGATKQLIVTVRPDDAENTSVSWESSNISVAQINAGVITAIAPGDATITVTTDEGSYAAETLVSVKRVYTAGWSDAGYARPGYWVDQTWNGLPLS
jgi:uncharacterized protein YjdB